VARASRAHGRVRIDMTPMVDVAFLLLIFFMSTTQFKPPESIAVALPASTSEVHVPETGTIILTVTAVGDVYIADQQGTVSEPVPKDALFDTIVDWRGRNPEAVVILKGDKAADFGVISDVMETLARAKTLRFNLMTDLKRRERGAAIEGH
jgi:biopolymer transport protein ExbD